MQTQPRPRLKGERVIVRLPEPTDRDAIIAYYRTNAEHLAQFQTPMPAEQLEPAFWDSEILARQDEFNRSQGCRMLVFASDDQTIIGVTSLFGLIRGAFQASYLGYSIDHNHEGQGFMKESLELVVRYAFDDLHLHRLMANYVPWNRRSHKLLEQLGFVIEGYAKEYLFIHGKWEDHVMTSLTNKRWKEENNA